MPATAALHYGETKASMLQDVGERYRYSRRHSRLYYRGYAYRYRPYGYRPYAYYGYPYRPYAYYSYPYYYRRPGISFLVRLLGNQRLIAGTPEQETR
jgi:hypothetical protein